MGSVFCLQHGPGWLSTAVRLEGTYSLACLQSWLCKCIQRIPPAGKRLVIFHGLFATGKPGLWPPQAQPKPIAGEIQSNQSVRALSVLYVPKNQLSVLFNIVASFE